MTGLFGSFIALLSLLWWIPAIVTSVFQAGYQTANQFFKLAGQTAVFWRGVIPFILFAPLPLFIPFPQDPTFYLSVLLASLLATYSDSVAFISAKRWGGGIVSRLVSLTPIFSFFIWFLFRPDLIDAYFDQPLISLALITLLIGVVVILYRLKACDINRTALIYMGPALVAMGLISLFNKNAMDHSPLLSGILYYIWLQAGFMAVVSFGVITVQNRSIKTAWKMVSQGDKPKAGLVIALFLIFFLGTKSFAYTLVEHPTYISVIQKAVTPLMVLFYYRLIRHREEGQIGWGLALVALAVLFIALESQLTYQ